MKDSQVSQFWDWFRNASSQLESLLIRAESRTLAELVGPHVDALESDLGGEIGPAGAEELFFAFTLNGSRDRIPAAKRIIDSAPAIAGWCFHVGRPAREWDGLFSLTNRFGQEVWLDASQWTYVLTGYDDNSFYDIQFFADTLPHVDDATRKQAALLVTDMYLGERRALEQIGDSDLLTAIPSELKERATPTSYLREHLDLLEGETRGS